MMTIELWDTAFRRLLLACLPKTGSSFLTSALANLPDFQKASLIPAYGRREQELDNACLANAYHANYHFVAHHHVRYSDQTQKLIELYSLQPIVLVRNIYDAVASVRDHLKTRGIVLAQAYIPADLPQWSDADIEQFVADMIVPWYFNFYATWSQCSSRIEVTYESLTADPFAVMRHICDRASISATNPQIRAALTAASANPDSSRFNVGITGRGTQLNKKAASRITKLAKYYSFLDLTPLGL